MKKIMVAGGGVLGSQIAFQAAYCGFDVTIWLRSEGSIGRTQPKLAHLKDVYTQTITRMDTPEGKAPQVWANGIADYANFDMSACLAQTERAAAAGPEGKGRISAQRHADPHAVFRDGSVCQSRRELAQSATTMCNPGTTIGQRCGRCFRKGGMCARNPSGVPCTFNSRPQAARSSAQTALRHKEKTRESVSFLYGGVGGIRTHGTVAGTPDFESGPL